MPEQALKQQISNALNADIRQIVPLTGGMIAEVYRVDLASGEQIVAKADESDTAALSIEGYMLRYLTENSALPVPEVLHCDDHLLLMIYLEGENHLGDSEQEHAADLLADLHNVTQPQYGLERDTLIGPLHQPNSLTDSWIEFFRQHRLLYMAHLAHRDGPLPASHRDRLEKLASQLHRWLHEPSHPSLIHGDIWTTNVMTHQGRIVGFIDPAIYYGHAEIELAYTTLFGTFGRTFGTAFFQRYEAHRPIEPGFFEERRHLYNLYPLLVHVRLFGGHYIDSVDETLRRFGF